MSEHSVLSASSADRWTPCPISVTGTAPDASSEAAAEGTFLHGVSETVLRGNDYPALGSKHKLEGFEFEYTESRHEDTESYVNFVRSKSWVGGYNVEARIHYGQYLGTPHALSFGTSDCYGFTEGLEGRVLEVVDLKMGRKSVSPVRNPQAVLYTAGVLQDLRPLLLPTAMPVRVSIFQPRLSRKPFVWETTVGEVERLALEMAPSAQAAVKYKSGTATGLTKQQFPEMPGAHCHYCRRKAECGEFKRTLHQVQPGATVVWDLRTFEMRDAITKYLGEVEDIALQSALRGEVLPGTKPVRGRNGHPKLLLDQAELRKLAQDKGVLPSIVKLEEVWATPAKTRDAFKRAGASDQELALLIETPPGKIQIVSASDPREAAKVGPDLSAFSL